MILRIILLFALSGATSTFAQKQFGNDLAENSKSYRDHNQELHALKFKIKSQQTTIKQQQISITELSKKIDSLHNLIDTNSANIKTISKSLGAQIQKTGKQAETRISELGGDVEKNRLYWIIATLITLLLGALMYLFLGKRIKSSQTDIETQIRNTKKSLEEESLKLDGELVKVFGKQLEVLRVTPPPPDDHSLVLTIADRLTAMETNLFRMNPKTPGVNILKTLIRSTKENFYAKEYEIVEMLGKEYKEGMEVIATFIPSAEIELDKKIITQIIKPQVNFKGKKIQAAEIVVSVGE